jgi:hypothetical protein
VSRITTMMSLNGCSATSKSLRLASSFSRSERGRWVDQGRLQGYDLPDVFGSADDNERFLVNCRTRSRSIGKASTLIATGAEIPSRAALPPIVRRCPHFMRVFSHMFCIKQWSFIYHFSFSPCEGSITGGAPHGEAVESQVA